MPTPAKVLGFVAAGCLGLAAIALVVLALSFDSCFGEPEDIEVTVEAPLEAARGSRFTLLTTIENRSARARKLFDIDVADEYLKGVAIEATDPPFTDSMHVPIDATVSYSFGIPIPAQGKVQVRFTVLAAHPGDFAGDLDICIDSEINCIARNIRTIIAP